MHEQGLRLMFSVIMPVWNRAEMAGKAIESVLAQTFEKYELIIVDDGSEDGLKKVVKHERPMTLEHDTIRYQWTDVPHKKIL
jgi:GT2 family glycosyltransferase